MRLALTLPKTEETGKIQCNLERELFSGAWTSSLWKALNLLLSGPIHTVAEMKFLDSWLANVGLPPEIKAQMSVPKAIPVDGVIQREFKEILRAVRPKLSEASVRATLYKHFFVTALYSERNIEQLTTMLDEVRESLEISSMLATLISDGLTTAVEFISYESDKLSLEEKEIIVAIVFIALNSDGQKHVLELNACRVVMATLSISTVNNVRLGALTQKTILDLFKLLTPMGQQVAFLNTLRMMVADGSIQEAERNLITLVSGLLPPHEVKTIKRVAFLECGKSFGI